MPTPLQVSTVIGDFMGSANAVLACVAIEAMSKSVYDPQGVEKISGGSSGISIGGVLSMVGGISGGAVGGSIFTDGGSGNACTGGSINTSGGSSNDANGGAINTSGNTLPGGAIDTHDGGGSINTRAAGSIQFGASGTRTMITGNATGDRALALPANSAACFVVQADAGWTAPGSAGDKTVAVNDYAAVDFSALDIGNIGLNALSTQVATLTKSFQALRAVLPLNLMPNA